METKKPQQENGDDIYQMPDFIRNMVGRGDYGKNVSKLAIKIKKLKPKDGLPTCVVYDFAKMEKLFGKTSNLKWKCNAITQKLKVEHGITKPRLIIDDGRVYIYQHKV